MFCCGSDPKKKPKERLDALNIRQDYQDLKQKCDIEYKNVKAISNMMEVNFPEVEEDFFKMSDFLYENPHLFNSAPMDQDQRLNDLYDQFSDVTQKIDLVLKEDARFKGLKLERRK